MANAADIYVAKESFVTNFEGTETIVHKGQTRVRAGHPLLKGREGLFEPLKIHYDVESATARPGEQRGAPVAPAKPVETAPEAAEATETTEKAADAPKSAPAPKAAK